MKTQIIQLEGHDDVISTRDKMGWGQTSRILLVWPARGSLLNRRLDLVLLLRHSLSLGAQLGLVTRDDDVRFLASELGIALYPTLRAAMVEDRSPRSKREKGSAGKHSASAKGRRRTARRRRLRLRKLMPRGTLLEKRAQARPQPAQWIQRPGVQLAAFALGVLAFLALLAVLLPGATIRLAPRQQIQTVTLPVLASPAVEAPRLTGEVPARWITIVVEGRDSLPTSGEVQVAEKTAAGGVVFSNLTEEAVQIPLGTVVRTSGANPVRFATTKAGEAPAGSGQQITLPVEALTPGSAGNVRSGAVQVVEGVLGLSLSASNPAALRNGSDQTAAGASTLDRQTLYQQMLSSLEETARQELQGRMTNESGAAEFPLLPSLQFSQALERRYQPEGNAPAERLELTLRVEFKALVITSSDLQQLALPLLEASLPEGYQAAGDPLRLEAVQTAEMIGPEEATWQFLASRRLEVVIPPQIAIQAALGLPAAEAAQRLYERLPLESPPEISLSPDWWPYLPFAPLRVEVK